jgi:hypothetical protein
VPLLGIEPRSVSSDLVVLNDERICHTPSLEFASFNFRQMGFANHRGE